MQMRSAPAASDRTAPSACPTPAAIAFMSRASVMTTPSKPRSWRSRPSRTGLRVAGSASYAGKTTCAVITHRDARPLQAGDERRAVAGDDLGRGAERADADDGVLGVGVDVDHGRQGHV